MLEVTCGTGYWTQCFAPVASSVVAIDSAPETLQIAQQRGISGNVTFQVGDAYALAPGRPGFTAAFGGFWFSHVPLARQHAFLAQLNAALQPGARVVVLDNLFVAGSSSAISERDAAGNTYQSRRLDKGSTRRVLKNFPSEAQLHGLMAAGIGVSARYHQWKYFWAFE